MPKNLELTLTDAILDDTQDVYELCRCPWLLNPSWEPPKKWWIDSFVVEKQIFKLAKLKWEIVWFVIWERTTWNIWYIWMLAVKEEFQNRWIWKILLEAAEQECKDRWLKVIVAYAYLGSQVPSKLMDKLNYEKWDKFEERIKFL